MIPTDRALAELFTTHLNEMQQVLNEVHAYLGNDPSPKAIELRQRIENLGSDGKEINEVMG